MTNKREKQKSLVFHVLRLFSLLDPFQRTYLSYFLAFLIFFQSAALYSQDQPSQGPLSHSQSQSVLPTHVEAYNPNVPLTIDQGHFSAAPGEYIDRFPEREPGEDPFHQEYRPETKLGHAIDNLQNEDAIRDQIYQLYNGLVHDLQAIEREQGENTKAYLEGLISQTNIPSFSIPGRDGKAELTQVDEKFIIRVVHGPTEVAFYILDETRFPEYTDHIEMLIGRQHFMSGNSRLDRKKGRDVIFLWKKGLGNTRVHILPYIQKRPGHRQDILPRYQDEQELQRVQRWNIRLYDTLMSFFTTSHHPSLLRQTIRENRRLHRRDYRRALSWRWPPNWNNVSFGISKALFNSFFVTGGLGLFQQAVTGTDFQFIPTMCVTSFFSITTCSFASTYRAWLNLGDRNFWQYRDHIGWKTSIVDRVKNIDWERTFKSRMARSAVTSTLFAWAFLYVTDPRVENITSVLDALWWFILMQMTALPNVIFTNPARVTFMQQAEINEHAGVINGDVTWHIPPFRSFTWSLKNLDALSLRYLFYDFGRVFHLVGPPLPWLTTMAASYGWDLHGMGINAGYLAMFVMYLLGKFVSMRMVLGYHYRSLFNSEQVAYWDPMSLRGAQGSLDSQQAWSYLDSMTRERTANMFLRIESQFRRMMSSIHSLYLPAGMREQLKDAVLGDENPTSLTEWEEQGRHRYHFERWRVHARMRQMANAERNLLMDRRRIDTATAAMEREFAEYMEETLGGISDQALLEGLQDSGGNPVTLPGFSFKAQIQDSFSNFAKVLHALSETLKTYYFDTPSSPVYQGRGLPETTNTGFYEQIWQRNANVEMIDILVLFKENVTKAFPHLKQALDIVAQEINHTIQVDVERLRNTDVLSSMLEEFKKFVRENQSVLEHVDSQQMRLAAHRSGRMLSQSQHSYQFHLDLQKRLPICIAPLKALSND